MSTGTKQSNFAYNFVYNLGQLKATLIQQYTDQNDVITLTVEEPKEGVKIEKYYKEGEEKPSCAVVYCKEGIFYYE